MTQTQAIETVWFVYSEDGRPLGRLYMEDGTPSPEVGAFMPDGEGWPSGIIAAVRELAPTCAMRRFRVTVSLSAG
jgi:hypothetical protein